MRSQRHIPFIILFVLSSVSTYAQNYFPPNDTEEWETISVDSLSWCSDELTEFYSFLEENQSLGIIVLHKGRIAIEKYFNDFKADSSWIWFSAGKSLMASMTGIAQAEGFLDINEPSNLYLGQQWSSLSNEQESAITIWHHLSMTTGLDWTVSDNNCSDPECLHFLHTPGDHWYYHNAPYSLLRDIIRQAVGFNFNAFFSTRLGNKIGMEGFWIKLGFNNWFLSDARAMARFGLLMLNNGDWNGEVVLSDKAFVDAMTKPSQSLNESYGLLWWLHGQSNYKLPSSDILFESEINPFAPPDTYSAIGAFGQIIDVVPSKDLVVVRIGQLSAEDAVPIDFHRQFWQALNKVFCFPVATEDTSSDFEEIMIIPNPADEFIEIITNEKLLSVQVYNSNGQAQNLDLEGNIIQLSAYNPGLYFFEIKTDNRRITKRIFIH